jgi:integrase
MVTDADGEISTDIYLPNQASKRKSGRTIPIHSSLRDQLIIWRDEQDPKSDFVVSTQRSSHTTAQTIVSMFFRWYQDCNLEASSHSGRRTAITNWARKISTVGGSLRDVQSLAGHSSLGMTQRYIDRSPDAQKRVVELN